MGLIKRALTLNNLGKIVMANKPKYQIGEISTPCSGPRVHKGREVDKDSGARADRKGLLSKGDVVSADCRGRNRRRKAVLFKLKGAYWSARLPCCD